MKRGTATAAGWKTMYFAGGTTFAPTLTGFSRKVVRFQFRAAACPTLRRVE